MSKRGMKPSKQKAWIDAIEKEDQLRLTWFTKNEARLEDIANIESKQVPRGTLEALKSQRIKQYRNVERRVALKLEYIPPIVPPALLPEMKPVDPATTRLIYSGSNKDGRVRYLKERYKLIPEDRYYFPETTNFRYGWNMWNCSKTMKKTNFGRQQVIKESFYRRRGVKRDPDWYKQMTTLSPTICN